MNLNSFLAFAIIISSFDLVAAPRWFEVEVLIFEQEQDLDIKEDFTLELHKIKTKGAIDLVSPALQLMGQTECLNKQFKPSVPFLSSTFLVQQSPVCDDKNNYIAQMQETPVYLDAEIKQEMLTPYLIAPEELQLLDTAKRLKRRGKKPILHTAWRQPAVKENRASSFRLYGGYNYSAQYNYAGELKNLETDTHQHGDSHLTRFIAKIQQGAKLENNQLTIKNHSEYPLDTWQLDGLFKVFMRGRYLNIKTDFNLRSEDTSAEQLQNAHFSQFKRVISGEIHYLDHPRMGILVQIRKYMH